MTPEETAKHKAAIDAMTHLEMARLWRFAPTGHPYFDRSLPLYDHYSARFTSLGGWTPAVSKAVGWKVS